MIELFEAAVFSSSLSDTDERFVTLSDIKRIVRQWAQSPETVEAVAKAISPNAFASWDRHVAYEIGNGKSREEAEVFAKWCDEGTHPMARVTYAREQAKAALAVVSAS